ncbi:MAG TPA: DUF3943 domain-containing protein [Mucilaginibacter sp.]|jgi:hypothetical protein|nr:DUF3943 domain-containing protein [Mucilaginibacter sp.]
MTVSRINLKKETVRAIPGLFAGIALIISGLFPSRSFAQNHFSQYPNVDSLANNHFRDSLNKKRFGRAAILWSLIEITPWVFDKYVSKASFADISFNTVRTNLKPNSWFWDDDDFSTNQLAHPSHGSIFFNSFRANGYSFWQSVPAAFAGSYVWETVGENQAPSINDLINTGFGGVVLGEMTNRFSNKILHNGSRGLKRQASEVLAFIINPANGMNRILDGKWGKIPTDTAAKDTTKIYAEIDLGVRDFKVNNRAGDFAWYSHAKLIYGSPYENYRTPFSYIYVNTEFGKSRKSDINLVSIYGSITGFWVQYTDNIRQMALLTANYDYIDNDAFIYSSQNIKLNLFSEFKLSDKLKINTTLAAGPILLAAVPDPYPNYGRPYDFCSGAGFGGSITLNIANKFYYGINYKGGWFTTLSGNASYYFLHTFTSELRYMIIDGFSVCAEPGYFTLNGKFKHYPDLDKTYPYLRLSVRYSLDL